MKVLIIRFSSFGDIVQAMGVPAAIKKQDPKAETHWATRSEFAEILVGHPAIQRVWTLDRRDGFGGLLRLAGALRKENFTHIYDAHNNLRSRILGWLIRVPHFLRRSKDRWKRVLLFRFRKNLFPRPYVGQSSYLDPLKAWGIDAKISSEIQFHVPSTALAKARDLTQGISPYIALVPATAWAMKTWPESHWTELVQSRPEKNFVFLGGPGDDVCARVTETANRSGRAGRVLNFAGKLSLTESAAVLKLAHQVVSADTGLLHVADQMHVPALALIGPTAFGFPASPTSKVLEVPLSCRPCTKDGRGRCTNTVYQRCMLEITPDRVSKELQ